MCGATGLTLQRHQIVRLPRKMIFMIDPAHIWNVIYNARTPVLRGYFSRFGDAFCIKKLQHFALRLSTHISPDATPATKSRTPT